METEEQPPQHLWIDKMENMQALEAMLENHEGSISAVKLALNDINLAVNEMFKNLNSCQYTRIIYVGAGTSARIGVQDGTELYPTFGWPKDRVDYIIAGGKSALTQPIENAEDDVEEAENMFKKLKITNNDILIGVSASGQTPFTLAVINKANKVNALTIGIGNNKGTKLQKIARFGITLQTGYEILAGSTRLKAGTAQKICLNLISTLCMSKLERIKNGKMSHLVATNNKLRIRKKNINEIK